MLISFFSTTDFTTGVDYSSHPDLVYQDDLDYDPRTQSPRLVESDGEYQILLDDLPPPPETQEAKVARISSLLISTPDYESVDTEGLTASDLDLDSLILARFFGGDRGKEIGYTQMMIYLSTLSDPNYEVLEERNKIIAGYEAKEKYKNYLKSLS